MNNHIENITNSTLNSVKSFIIKQSLNPGEASFLFYFKLFSFFVILLITFSFGLLPIFFAKYRQTTILNYANPFAGGVFIGIGLFHLLPDASYDFENYYKSKEGSTSFFYGFPMSYFIAFLSYSFILYLEKVAFNSHALIAHTHGDEENALSEDNENDLKEPLIRKSSKKIYHDCTNDLYEDNEKDLFFQQNNNDNNYSKERDEIGNDEQIIRNIISSKGQFSSVLHSRNISK